MQHIRECVSGAHAWNICQVQVSMWSVVSGYAAQHHQGLTARWLCKGIVCFVLLTVMCVWSALQMEHSPALSTYARGCMLLLLMAIG